MSENEAIRELIARERQSRVTADIPALEACYWPDALVVTSWTGGCVPVERYLHGGKAPVHDPERPIVSRIAYPIVHRRGARAYVEAPQTTLRWLSLGGVRAVLTCYMRLIYEVERRDGAWRIVYFGSVYESDTLQPEIPGEALPIDRERWASLRHAYRNLAYVDAGTSPDLPGIDRPESVRALYDRLEQWLAGGETEE